MFMQVTVSDEMCYGETRTDSNVSNGCYRYNRYSCTRGIMFLTALLLRCAVQVVEQLLKSNLCEKLLEDSPTDTLDNSRTTCLHLAAKNGHSDIIR